MRALSKLKKPKPTRILGGALGLLLALSLVLMPAVPVLAVPAQPHQFWGMVTIGTELAPEGTIVSAQIGEIEYASTTVDAQGRYGYKPEVDGTGTFKVPADDPDTPEKEGGEEGETVEFYITNEAMGLDSVKANETAEFEIWGITELPLTVHDTINPSLTMDDIADYVNVLAQISGTASDNVAMGKVEVSIDNTTDGGFWNGTDWSSETEVWLDATGTETWTYTMPALTSGKTYQVRAKAIDSSENESTIASDSFTFDTTAPEVEITSPSEGALLNSLYVAIVGTATEVAEVTVDGSGGMPVFDEAFSIALTFADEGAKSITVTATDAAGNVGSDTIGFTIDVTDPMMTIDPVTTPTNTATQTLTGRRSAGLTVVLTSAEATFGAVTYPTSTIWSCQVTLVEGSNVITATATDAAGNTGTATTTIVLDTTAPSVMIGAVTTPTDVATQTLTGTMEEGATVALTSTEAAFGDVSYDTTIWSCEITLIEGSNEITATATDAVGNEGTATTTIVLDTIVPTVEITSPLEGALLNSLEVTIEGTATEVAEVVVDGQTAPIVDGAFSVVLTLTEGANSVTATATDTAGNAGSDTVGFTIDVTAPVVTIGTVTTPTDVATQALTGTMEEGATVALTSAEATFGAVTYPTTTTWSCEVTLVEGSNEITATATDAVGNEVMATTTIVLDTAVDETPPAQITDLAANPGSPATTKVVLGWTAPGDDEDAGTATSYEIRRSTTSEITDANWALATTIYNNIVPQATGGLESFVVSRLTPDTTYYFAIQAKDEADNISLTSNSASITTAIYLPVIIDISPTSGENSQAWTLTIDGNNFVDGGTNVVRFVSDDNTFDLTNVTCSSSTQLTADVAKGAPTGTYKVRVINDNGTSELTVTVTYEVTEALVPLPVVTNLIPQMVASDTPVSGVQIFGEYLAGAIGVSFGGTATSNVMVISDTNITVDVPGLSAGEYDVKVTTPAGTNEISGVKFVVSDPVAITEDTTEDTTTSEVVKLDTNVIPVQLTLTTDTSETATQATDADAEIEVTIPPQTTVTCEDEPYVGTINPPRVVKPDESVLTDLSDDAVVIEMGNPEKTLKFDQDFVAIVTITAPVQPVIWYYNKDTQAYELAGKTGTKDGVDYVPGGTNLGQENSTYTMGLLLDQMSLYVAGVKPDITSTPATVTADSAFTITGDNFHPTAAEVYFGDTAGTIVSRSSTTEIVARFPTAGSYTLKVENPDKLSDTTSIRLTTPPGPAPPPPTPPAPPPGTTDVRGMITTAGVFLEPVTATSDDELCTLTIPEGTVGLTEELEPIDEITVVIMDEPPPPPEDAHVVGLAYDLGPDGATFDPPIALTFSYDPNALPEGVAEEDLVLAYYDEATGEWVELDGVVDTENNTITASVPHFTTFAVIGVVPVVAPPTPTPPTPARFTISSLGVSPSELAPGEEVNISVLVANTGGKSGSYTVVLNIDGVKEAEERVRIAAGRSQSVSFTVSKEDAGSYSVVVDGLSDSFTVVAVVAPPVTPLAAPAAFSVSNLTIQPAAVRPNERVIISVAVANTGGTEGSYNVVLLINDIKEAEKSVTVAAGSYAILTFNVTREEAGNYTVEADGVSGSFTVVSLIEPPGVNWALIGGIIGGVIVVGLGVFFWIRRRAY